MLKNRERSKCVSPRSRLLVTVCCLLVVFGACINLLLLVDSVQIAEWIDNKRLAGPVALASLIGLFAAPVVFAFLAHQYSRNRSTIGKRILWVTVVILSIETTVFFNVIGSACAGEIAG